MGHAGAALSPVPHPGLLKYLKHGMVVLGAGAGQVRAEVVSEEAGFALMNNQDLLIKAEELSAESKIADKIRDF